MLYRIGSPSYRKSDTCYYDIHSVPDTELKGIKSVLGLRIFMKVIKKKNVNVYLYGGRDRFNAIGNVVYGNEQVEIGKNYTVKNTEGFMMIAYPEKDVETELEFEYWIADMSSDLEQRLEDLNFDGKDGQVIFIGLIMVIVLIILCLCCIGFCCAKVCMRQKSDKV